MSGDVQPRKRKDKKRKKDDVPPPQGHHGDPDEVMHVQNEQNDGGGQIASLVFYFLLTLLMYFSAKIMYDNRGLIGLGSSLDNSRFGTWFDGWVEDTKHYDIDQDNTPIIDDEDIDIISDTILDSVSEEESHSEQEDIDLDLEDTGKDEPSDESQELNNEVIEDLDEDISIDNYAIQEDDIIKENVEVPMIKEDNEQVYQKGVKREYTIIYRNDIEDDSEENQFINGMENPEEIEEETKNANEFDNVKYYSTIIDYTDLEDLDPALDTSKEREIIPEDSDEDQIEHENTDQEEIVDNDAGEEEHLRKQEAIKVATSEDGSSKPSIDKNEQRLEDAAPNLSRRDTIVRPPPIETLEHNMQNIESDEYSDDEELEDESEDDIIIESEASKSTYQEIRSTYQRTFTPESDKQNEDIVTVEELKQTNSTPKDENPHEEETEYEEEVVEEQEDDDERDDEELEHEDLDDIGQDEQDYDDEDDLKDDIEQDDIDQEYDTEEDEISDVDDEELLKKLEAKYGKLPSTTGSKTLEDSDEEVRKNNFDIWKKNSKGDASNEQWPQEIKRTEDQSSNNAWQHQVKNAEAEISDVEDA